MITECTLLTPIEYKLLLLLISNRGKVVTHSQIQKKFGDMEKQVIQKASGCLWQV